MTVAINRGCWGRSVRLQRSQQARQQGCPPGQFRDEDVLVARMGAVAYRTQTVERWDA